MNLQTFYEALYGAPNHLNFGKVKRNAIKLFFDSFPEYQLPVNREWQPQVHKHPELMALIKQGFL